MWSQVQGVWLNYEVVQSPVVHGGKPLSAEVPLVLVPVGLKRRKRGQMSKIE